MISYENCEYFDDGYETETICENSSPRREVNKKTFLYVTLDGGKPLVVDGPWREGTALCRVELDVEHQVARVFFPVFNKKGEVTREVEYKVNLGVALALPGKATQK